MYININGVEIIIIILWVGIILINKSAMYDELNSSLTGNRNRYLISTMFKYFP